MCLHWGHDTDDCNTYRCPLCKVWRPEHFLDECPVFNNSFRKERSPNNSDIHTSSSSSLGPNPDFPQWKNHRCPRKTIKKLIIVPPPRSPKSSEGKGKQCHPQEMDTFSDILDDVFD